jgi:hypothetical protein
VNNSKPFKIWSSPTRLMPYWSKEDKVEPKLVDQELSKKRIPLMSIKIMTQTPKIKSTLIKKNLWRRKKLKKIRKQ